MGKIPIECCRGCKLRTECGNKYKGQFPPCHKIAVAASSTSTNTAMLQLLCSIDKYLDETNCDVEPGDPFHTKIKAVLAQQQHS